MQKETTNTFNVYSHTKMSKNTATPINYHPIVIIFDWIFACRLTIIVLLIAYIKKILCVLLSKFILAFIHVVKLSQEWLFRPFSTPSSPMSTEKGKRNNPFHCLIGLYIIFFKKGPFCKLSGFSLNYPTPPILSDSLSV